MLPLAYSYVRFSTPEQERGDSYRRQTEQAQAWAAKNGLTLDNSLSMTDRGVSAFRGRNSRTGALGAFLASIDDGLVPEGSYLLVESLDRVSRADPWEALPVFQQIINAGVMIVTMADGRTYSREGMRANPMGILESLFVMIRANDESRAKSRRVAAAWEGKRKQAAEKPLTERAPAWMKLDRAAGCFRLVDDRAAVVRRIFAMTLEGTGLEAIAATLNRNGVPTFGDAAHWHKSYVAKIIASPAAGGTMVPHRVDWTGGKKVRVPLDPIPGYFPAAVDPDTFQAVQAQRLGVRAPRSGAKPAALNSLLAGLARCPLCEGSMTRVMKGGSSRAGKSYLVCAKAKAGAGCTYRAVPQGTLEAALVDRLGVLIAVPPEGDHGAADRAAALRVELAALDSAIRNLVDALAGQPSPALRAKLAALEADKVTLEAALERAGKVSAAADPIHRSRRVADLRAAVEAEPMDRAKVNATLRQCFEAVTVDYRAGWLLFAWRQGSIGTIPYAAPEEPAKAA